MATLGELKLIAAARASWALGISLKPFGNTVTAEYVTACCDRGLFAALVSSACVIGAPADWAWVELAVNDFGCCGVLGTFFHCCSYLKLALEWEHIHRDLEFDVKMTR